MTTPADGWSADDFLATTQVDADGEVSTEYIKLQDVSDELLLHYVMLGDDRATAELASRLTPDAVPEPSEEAS